MSKSLKTKLLKEAVKRTAHKAFNLVERCFKEQLDFISDPSRFKTATCSRRSGKTIGIAHDYVDTCINEKNVICLYTTLTSKSARSIIWGDFKKIIEEYKLPVKTDETRLTIKFLNTGSEIRLGGAKDEQEIEKYRGWKLRKACVDEAQSFRPYLTYFINDILMPALRDQRGTLIVTGTPGPVLAGPFYDISHSDLWSQHRWTAFKNPHMLDLEKTLAEERAVKGISEDDPGYIRETYGEWVEDLDSLVFKYSREKNRFTDFKKDDKYSYIFGIDIGFEDADAIAVLAYSHADKNVYLVQEVITAKQTISKLVSQVEVLQKAYQPIKMVMDAGALGKKIQEEIRQRHGINLEAAEKHRKLEFIELLNDDLRTGKFKSFPESRFEQDCFLVTWEKTVSGKRIVSDKYHTDIGDAVLYAWRECRHYFQDIKDPTPAFDSEAYMEMLEAKEAQALEDEQNRNDFEPDIDLNEDIDDF